MTDNLSLPHEKLEAFQAAKQMMTLTKTIVLPNLSLSEIQVAGELQSKVNYCFTRLVEGANRPQKRARDYQDALEMAMECCGLWEGCRALNILDAATFAEGETLLRQLVAGLRAIV
jgi:hypothetical protein